MSQLSHSHGNAGANLAEHANCCGHMHWWRHLAGTEGGRKPFALPGTPRQYAPDMTCTVHHTKLTLAVDPVAKTLEGHCATTVEPIAAAVDSVFFAAINLQVEAASLIDSAGATALKFDVLDKGVLVHLPKTLSRGEKAVIDLAYRTLTPKLGIYFTGPSPLYPSKPYQVWTQSQDDDAQHWFPVAGADHPNHKMTSEVEVTVPAPFTALSNGRLVNEVKHDAAGDVPARTTFHWSHDKPHSSYLFALVVGEFVKLEEDLNGLPVQAYVHPAMLERAREYFKGTADLVALYGRLYGTPYPWDGKYAQVFVQDFIFGGMENTTITVMTDRILADASTRSEQRLQEVRLNAHELNHHWNGDLVTCRDWSHAWLNEGGATFGEVEAVEHLFGEKARDYYALGLARAYFAEDKRYRRPIVCNTFREPIDLFDRHLYQKGGLVRLMLRHLLGREAYYASIQTYYRDNAYQPVETLDLIKAIEKTTGRNMRRFFDQWVFGAGFPEFKVSYRYDAKQKMATVKIDQVQKVDKDTGLFAMPIDMSFDFADGSRKEVTVEVDEASHSFSFALDAKPAMFRFDPHNIVLKTLELDVPRGMLVHQLHNDPAVMGRIYAAQTLAKAGGDDVVEELAKAVENEHFYGVGIEAASLIGGIAGDASRRALKKLVKVADPRVRRSVVSALGNFQTKGTAQVLAALIKNGETSSFVLADACVALGKTKQEAAFDVLKEACNQDSWNEIVRIGAFNGLAELGDKRGAAVVAEFAQPGKPFAARPAAIAALGRLGKEHGDARDELHKVADCEDSAQFTLRMSIVSAIGTANHKDSLKVLKKLEQSSHDGRIKRLISETASGIKGGAEQGASRAKAADLNKIGAKLGEIEGAVKSVKDQLGALTAKKSDKKADKKSAKKAGKKADKKSAKKH